MKTAQTSKPPATRDQLRPGWYRLQAKLWKGAYKVMFNHARQLERELAKAQKKGGAK